MDIVDLAKSVGLLSTTYRKQLELDAMASVSEGEVMSTQSAYLNIR